MSKISVPVVTVNDRAARRLQAGHLWVYQSDLSSKSIPVPAAAMVYVSDQKGRFLGAALSSSSSQIALRLISPLPFEGDVNRALLQTISERVSAAVHYRKRWVKDSNAYRVIFSEADGLPGLIVDRYEDVFTLQVLTQAMDREDLRATIVTALKREFGQGINLVERAEARIRDLENLAPMESRLLSGSKTKTIFSMNGIQFNFDALSGQKSGAFLDQRENYAAAARYAHGEALDVFCYQGGFALHLARVCDSVTGVDSSRPALEVAEANAQLNAAQFTKPELEWIEANAFDLLKDYAAAKQMYDTIVLDPPAFAKSKRMLETAVRGYKELNLRALKMLRPGGILITNSCSHHLSEAEFSEMLASASADAKRTVKILEKRTQSIDHPVVITIPETAYLKCFICQVD
jgi:23S rRNA (cytosine1962-C5)-methyltransferase